MVRKAAVIAVLVTLSLACHTVIEDPPARQQPTAPAPVPIVIVPIPVVSQAPVPAPTSAPTGGGPTPTPAPTSPPAGACGLPPGTGSGNSCPYQHPSFQDAVELAIDRAIQHHPSLFNMNDSRCPQGCPRVLDSDGYWDAVTSEIRGLGYCATNDGEELAVKNTNNFNDQYDIISGDGYIRRGAGAYRSTCYPAWF